MFKPPCFVDSRSVCPGGVFICLPGAEPYISEAKSRGADLILKMDRVALSDWAKDYYNHPSSQLVVIGVTGTNGKTTVVHLVSEALKKMGESVLTLGTLTQRLTTLESVETQALMASHLASHGTYVVMEVSSHGLDQGRVLGIDFNVKCLTNITQDHLDYHGSFEAYQSVKRSFMTDYPGQCIDSSVYDEERLDFSHCLLGGFNLSNLKAAMSILQACGFDRAAICSALSEVKMPSGRFESLSFGQPFEVIVDYAHTPDALANLLNEGRILADSRQGRLLTVFGCGGDRDSGKRVLMGDIAADLSDWVVVTSDNPRFEDPQRIIDDVLARSGDLSHVYSCIDRQEAICSVLDEAHDGDVVMVAGKGHEEGQIIKEQVLPFQDQLVIQKRLEEMGYGCFD